MTTTTEPRITDITVTLLEGNLANDCSPTRAAIELLAQQTAEALADAFPGARIEVPIRWRTSGAGPAPAVYADGESPTREQEEEVARIATATWESWVQGLADSDLVREEE